MKMARGGRLTLISAITCPCFTYNAGDGGGGSIAGLTGFPILLNLKINDPSSEMAVSWPLLNGSQRRSSGQGAILVPNSRLARGNGL